MFSRIRWRSLRCVTPPASPSSPVQDDIVNIYDSSDKELPALCVCCKQKIYGVKCFINDGSDRVVHFGCLGILQTVHKDEEFQNAVHNELRSLQRHVKSQARRLHEERWQIARTRSVRRVAPTRPPDGSVDSVSVAQLPPLPCLPPSTKEAISPCSYLSKLWSGPKKVYGYFSSCWPGDGSCLPFLKMALSRRAQFFWQWVVRRTSYLHSPDVAKIERKIPRRIPQSKTGVTRLSRTMTRGAALSRISAARRRATLKPWATIRLERKKWLLSKQPLHRRILNYLTALCKKGTVQLRVVVEKAGILQCHRGNTNIHSPLRSQLFCRALTVGACAVFLQCGKILALPTWLAMVSAYGLAAIVPMQLPPAHSENCRVATTIAASALAATHGSFVFAGLASVLLWLCPAWALWWPHKSDAPIKQQEDKHAITSVLNRTLAFMDDHEDMLPYDKYTKPTPEQKEEISLRTQFNWQTRSNKSKNFTKEQSQLYQEILRRRTSQADLQTIEEARRFRALHNGRLPMRTRDDKIQSSLAWRLSKLQNKKNKSAILQNRLEELLETSHKTPTKSAARGAKQRDRKRAASSLLAQLREDHVDWCQLHFPLEPIEARREPKLHE